MQVFFALSIICEHEKANTKNFHPLIQRLSHTSKLYFKILSKKNAFYIDFIFDTLYICPRLER